MARWNLSFIKSPGVETTRTPDALPTVSSSSPFAKLMARLKDTLSFATPAIAQENNDQPNDMLSQLKNAMRAIQNGEPAANQPLPNLLQFPNTMQFKGCKPLAPNNQTRLIETPFTPKPPKKTS